MIDENIIGKYWLCGSPEDHWLVQGGRPISEGDNMFCADYKSDDDMRWLRITDEDDYAEKGKVILTSSAFKDFDFPSLPPEGDGIIEIEICKSGKVYWYES